MNEQATVNKDVLVEIAEMKRAHSALMASLPHRRPVCIAVTSAAPGEGKTTMLAGLAALSGIANGRKVLAMDTNWHAPSLHRFFGAELIDPESDPGQTPVQKMVYHVPEFNLDVLPAFKELLFEGRNGAGQAMAERLLDRAREAYDLIYVDTSRIFPLNRHMIDPVAIANRCDGVALVVASAKTPRREVMHAQFVLESAGAHLLGVIINDRENPLA